MPELMARLGSLPAEQRKAFGQAVNGLKARVGEALEGRKAELERGALSARLATEKADITLPVRLGPWPDGAIHPVTQVMHELTEIFGDMGFAVAARGRTSNRTIELHASSTSRPSTPPGRSTTRSS